MLALHAKIFPIGQGYAGGDIPGWNWPFIGSAVYHSLLPAFTLIITNVAGWMLTMRNVMITTNGEDYVLAAQAKGLPHRRVVLTYAARNAILPQLSGFRQRYWLCGVRRHCHGDSLLVPRSRLVTAQRGYLQRLPTNEAIFLVISFAVLFANLIVDVVYVLIDPRARARTPDDSLRAH